MNGSILGTNQWSPSSKCRTSAVPLILVIVLFGAATPAGQPFWESKEWRLWSRTQTYEMLGELGTGSPWVSLAGDVTNGNGFSISTNTLIQVRSALPIRFALVRQKQFKAKYDKLSAPEKLAFDEQVQSDLNQDMGDRVIFRIRTSQHGQGKYAPALGARPPDPVYLILSDGTRINALSVEAVQGSVTSEFDAVFPRSVNGQSIFKVTDKRVTFECRTCDSPLEFSPPRMIFRGKLEY